MSSLEKCQNCGKTKILSLSGVFPPILPNPEEMCVCDTRLDETKVVNQTPETDLIKKLYALYVANVLPKGATSRKEREMLFEFAGWLDNVIEDKVEGGNNE